MNMRSLVLLALLFSLTLVCGAQEAKPAALQNLNNVALNMPYTMDPAPKYQHCTDPGDTTQLTDGQYTQGYFWTQPGTVGWSGQQPIITIDLGSVQPICGVSFNTAAGVAGVFWPTGILMFVAREDKQFYEAGELTSLSATNGVPPAEAYAVHRFWTNRMHTHGRYISFVVQNTSFAFVDEIEVYAGEPEWVNEPLSGESVADVKGLVERLAVQQNVRRRIMNDAVEVRKRAEGQGGLDAVLADLDAVVKETGDLKTVPGPDFRAVLPLNDLHARVFRSQAALWRAKGVKPVFVWTKPLWDPLSHLEDPPEKAEAAVNVHMMQNEYRAGAFNVTNATEQPLECEMRILGLPADIHPASVTVHSVEWTDTGSGIPVAAALPEAERAKDACVIRVPSGMTRQMWLTFHPVNVEPGSYTGRIEIRTEGATLEVPLSLEIYPLRFPEQPTLHLGGWDYTNVLGHYEVTAENRPALIAHLRERFVDSPWATGGTMLYGKYDDAGKMTEPPDTSNFDAWVGLWSNAGQYCVFPSVSGKIDRFEMGTPAFETAVGEWTRFWAGHAQTKGVKPEQLALLLVDEPQEAAQDAIILAWAKALRAANTGIRVWEDPIYHDMSKASSEMIAACHVLCPNRQIFYSAGQEYRDFYVKQREAGIGLEFYSCSGPMRLLDPYRYVRLQAWTCRQYGATAMYFWAFADGAGASSWNEYTLKRSAYTPVFLDKTSVTAGKHMEAAREGVEDYEYFEVLEKVLDTATAKGAKVELLEKARRLLAEAPAQVLDADKSLSFAWNKADTDRTGADLVRIEILRTLVELKKTSGQ